MRYLLNNRYNLVPSISTRTSSLETEDEEAKVFLTQDRVTTPKPDHNASINKTLLLITILNILLFIASASFFTVRYYDQHLSLNHVLRQASTYSKSLSFLFYIDVLGSSVEYSTLTPYFSCQVQYLTSLTSRDKLRL
jgi:ABC-type spermidine/putrescine transport system permease subunit I